jgi:hypothetical protein
MKKPLFNSLRQFHHLVLKSASGKKSSLSGILLLVLALTPASQAEDQSFKLKLIAATQAGRMPLYVHFLGANPRPEVFQQKDTTGHFNPLMGNDPGNDPVRWRAGVAAFRQMIYRQLYPGIDLICYGSNGRLEYNLSVSAWADPSCMRVTFDGINEADFSGPLPAYQLIDGMKVPVDVSMRKTNNNDYEYVIGRYDRSKDLIIASTNPVTQYARQ